MTVIRNRYLCAGQQWGVIQVFDLIQNFITCSIQLKSRNQSELLHPPHINDMALNEKKLAVATWNGLFVVELDQTTGSFLMGEVPHHLLGKMTRQVQSTACEDIYALVIGHSLQDVYIYNSKIAQLTFKISHPLNQLNTFNVSIHRVLDSTYLIRDSQYLWMLELNKTCDGYKT